MAKVVTLLILLFFSSINLAQKLVWQGKNNEYSIHYNPQKKSYILKILSEKMEIPRHLYNRITLTLSDKIKNPHYLSQIETIFYSFHHKLSISAPTAEESFSNAMRMKKDALDVVNNPVGSRCNTVEYFKNKGPQLQIALSPKTNEGLRDKLFNIKMHDDGFFSMGELIGVGLSIKTGNDNIGHGIYQLAGGSTDSKIEGDDRGFTFSISESGELLYKNGSIKLEHYAKGYSRLAPQKGSTYSLNGQQYVSSFRTDKDGKFYQEFLNVEGVQLELRRKLNGDDTYVKVVANAERLTDQSGTALKIQKSWHKAHEDHGTIQYNNVDHMEEQNRFGLGLSVGKGFDIYERDNFRVRSAVDTGAFVSSGGSEATNVAFRGEITIDSNEYGSGDSATPSYELSLSGENRFFADGEKEQEISAEFRRNWVVNKNNKFHFKTSVSSSDDRYSNEFGTEELQRNGKLDLNYFYGAGWTYKF